MQSFTHKKAQNKSLKFYSYNTVPSYYTRVCVCV